MFQIIGNIICSILKLLWLVGKTIFRLIIPVTPKSVRGEIALITGAANGIGRELALQYASQGAIVVCWDIDEKGNLETVERIRKLGYPPAYAYACNIANREEVMEMADKVRKDVGNVTILINNAGIFRSLSFLDLTSADIQQTININVVAHFWMLQAFLPAMIKHNHGHIVATCSVAGLIGVKTLTSYCASKFAIRGFMEALRQDLRADGNCNIKITCVYPFIVNTAMYDSKTVVVKLPKVTPVYEPKYVAKYIMNAQRCDVSETTIPKYMLHIINFTRY
ncbi:hypothetical protein ILUMI_05572, partial [Ignelater luminosus]